jgi:hypothetical protein
MLAWGAPWRKIAEQKTLIRLLRAAGATDENIVEVKTDIRRWNRGGVWIDVTDLGQRLLRLRPLGKGYESQSRPNAF